MKNNKAVDILIVDDNPDNLDLLKKILEAEGYNTRCAPDGRTAFMLAFNAPPDLILLDILMPEMDGYAVCQKLKHDKITREIPVIFISSLDDATDKVEAFKVGGVDYIIKPFNPEEVLMRVQTHIELRRMRLDLESLVAERTSKLQESENKIRLLLDSTAEAIYGLDMDGNCSFANKACIQILGYKTTDELIGQNMHDLIHHSYPDATPYPIQGCPIFQAFQKGEYVHVDNEVLWRADGTSFPTEYWSYPIFHDDQIKGAVVTFLDITERKRAETELKSRTHDLRERVKELRCLYNISKIAEEVDLSIEETTQRIVNLIPPAWQYPDITCARIFFQGKEFKTEDFETSIWKQTSDISVYGKRIGTVEVYFSEEKTTDFEGPFLMEERDLIEAISERLGRIIERKEAEEEKQKLESQLVQAQKMEAIGTLAGGIAHDLNNILSPIIGYAELLKMKLSEDSSSQADLAEVLKAGLRARDLTAQILAFSRQGDQERVPVLIDLIVKEALKLLRASIPTTIEIRHKIAKCRTTLADATQVHQVVMNLCTNAYHAMEERGGTLEVSLSEVEINDVSVSQFKDLKPGPYVQLTISDTGPGIDPKIMDRIFDPYFTTKEKGKGTGLGLSVVHGIVKNHGGTIRVDSKPLKGTTFHVYFPLSKKVVDADKAAFEPIPTGNERILFVDDEQMLINLGKRMLERLGYLVTTETNSMKALELFRKNPDKFDLILTDMTMPNLTGVQLAQTILQIRSDIPIVLCTGFSELISEEKVKRIGISDFLMKPLDMKNLADSVRKALDEHKS